MTSAFAQTLAPTPAPAMGPQEGLAGFAPLLIIFVVFWFLVIRPQSKRMKDQKLMIQNLKRGDEIVTTGGIIGKIDRVVDEGELMVKIADGITVRVARQSVAALLSKPEPVNENGTPSEKKSSKSKKKKDASESEKKKAQDKKNKEDNSDSVNLGSDLGNSYTFSQSSGLKKANSLDDQALNLDNGPLLDDVVISD
jgi:preprotein translocase subunit YajC